MPCTIHSPSEHSGTVNSATFDTQEGGYNFAAGELLYVGFDDNNRYWDANEDWVVDLVYAFRFAAGGWNYGLNREGTLVEVSLDGTAGGGKPYSSNAFANLFTVD